MAINLLIQVSPDGSYLARLYETSRACPLTPDGGRFYDVQWGGRCLRVQGTLEMFESLVQAADNPEDPTICYQHQDYANFCRIHLQDMRAINAQSAEVQQLMDEIIQLEESTPTEKPQSPDSAIAHSREYLDSIADDLAAMRELADAMGVKLAKNLKNPAKAYSRLAEVLPEEVVA